jgi:Tfp pilus assembly protein PilO
MKNLPTQAKVAIFAVALVVLFAVGFFVLVKPQRKEAAQLQQQVADAQAELERLQAGPSTPNNDVEPIRVADLFKLSRAMPDRPDIANVLLELSAISSETGITFQSITPHDPQFVNGYRRIPIDLVFEGHFYDLSDFLYRVRNLVGVHDGELDAVGRLFAVHSISFGAGDQEFPQVRASLTLDAYTFGDGTSVPTPAPSAEATPTETVAPTEEGPLPIPAAPASSIAAAAR